MKKTWIRLILIPIMVVCAGGILLVGLSWIAYYGIVLAVEATFFAENPTNVPIDQIRNASALLFGIAGIALLTTKIRDLAKATILVGPLTTFQIALFLQLYETPFLALGVTLFIAGLCIVLIRWIRKPWFFYLSVGLSTLVAVLYSWPVPGY